MLTLILILNVAIAIVGGRILFRLTHNYAIWFFEFVFLLFFVGRPVLNGMLGVPDPSLLLLNIDDGAILTYVLCGLIFAVVFHPVVYWLFGRQRILSDHFLYLCDFENVSKSRFALVFIGFSILTYALNGFKFHSLSYIFVSQDSFEAGMNLAGGLYFVQMMSSALMFPCIVLLAKSLNARPVRLACILFVTMAGFIALVHPSERTGVIALLVAVIIYKLSIHPGRLRLVSVVTMGTGAALLTVLLLSALNFARQNQSLGDGGGSALLSVFAGFWGDTAPAANGMILIDYFRHHDWFYFRYVLLSMLPTNAIPSAIFPFKPRIDMEGMMTYNIFGAHLDPNQYHEGGTLTFTVPAAGYADLGYVGVIVAAVLYAFFFAAFLRGWKSRAVTVKFMTLYYLILVVAALRLSIDGLAVIFYSVLILMFVFHAASHSRVLSVTAGHELVQEGTREGLATNRMFLLCIFLTTCVLCLLFYALAS